jgi:plasmid stabilization system protein ParE
MLQKRIADRAKTHMDAVRLFTKEQWGASQSVKYMNAIRSSGKKSVILS